MLMLPETSQRYFMPCQQEENEKYSMLPSAYERMTEWTGGRMEKRTSRDYTVKVNGCRRIMIFAVYYSTNWQINNVVLSYLINWTGYLAADEQSNFIAARLFVSNVIYLVLSNCDGCRLVLRSTRFVTWLAEIHSRTLSLHNVVSSLHYIIETRRIINYFLIRFKL